MQNVKFSNTVIKRLFDGLAKVNILSLGLGTNDEHWVNKVESSGPAIAEQT